MTDIIKNKKAFFDYHIEETFEAGLVLEGWEVKAIRENRLQLKDAHIIVRGGELFLLNTHISPLPTASKHIKPEPERTRKLLMHKKEIMRLIGKVEQKGYTLIPVNIHQKNGRYKCEMALAKGKKEFDKRQAEKDRDWLREKSSILKQVQRS